MKRLVCFCILLALLTSLCACKSSINGTQQLASEPSVGVVVPTQTQEPAESSEPTEAPTEDPFRYIQIIAPVDIYEGNAPEDSNIMLTVQEGYKLIQDMNSDDYPYGRYYAPLSSGFGAIEIVPIILEEKFQVKNTSFTARTNFSAFVTLSSGYRVLGQETTHPTYVSWRGDEHGNAEKPDHIWIDVLMRAAGKIFGLAVLEIVTMEINGVTYENGYMVADRYTEFYPLVDGKFQEIDEEFVWQRAEQYHKFAE